MGLTYAPALVRMRSDGILEMAAAAVVVGLMLLFEAGCSRQPSVEAVLAAARAATDKAPLNLRQPLDGTLFPRDIAPCAFDWEEHAPGVGLWLVVFEFGDGGERRAIFSRRPEWTPEAGAWEEIKSRAVGKEATVTICGLERGLPVRVRSEGRIRIRTSEDPVGAPLFYREVNLPFFEAVKDPTRIRWRFGAVSDPNPPRVVLEHLPVCGNCHSFSRDGRVLGMDVDYANNKGSYVVTAVAREMVLSAEDVFTWDAFRPEDRRQTFGLLSQVSPDGRAVISTVKDKSVFVPKPDLAFSQLFFPIQGILAVYDRETRTFESLPGADDPAYVQSNPVWSPDGQTVVFARAPAYRLRNLEAEGKLLLSEEDCAEFLREGKEFRFDLYRVPYSGGRGGRAEPLAGASRNGQQLLPPVFTGRPLAHLLPGAQLHAAATGQRAVHHPRRGGRGAEAVLQHGPDELVAQLVAQQPLARVRVQGGLGLHAAVSDTHRRTGFEHAAHPALAVHRPGPGRQHP